MFTVEVRSSRAELTDHGELRRIARELQGRGYRALTEGIMLGIEGAAGLTIGALDTEWLAPQRNATLRRILPEVLFSDDGAFVLAPAGKRLDAWEVRQHERSSALEVFCEAVADAAKSALGQARVADLSFDWKSRMPAAKISASEDEPPMLAASNGSRFVSDDLRIARALVDPGVRELVTELARAGSKVTPVERSSAEPDGRHASLRRLGLVEREYLLVCRQDGRMLCRVSNAQDLAQQIASQIACPVCGRSFSEELGQQVDIPTAAARKMLEQNFWMVVWITSLLVERGVPEEAVAWVPASSGDGLALMVDAMHGRLLIELSDREFGPQEAYAFTARLARDRCQFGFVVTSKAVTEEVMAYLRQHADSSFGTRVSVLEGSEAVTRRLGPALDEWSIATIRVLTAQLLGSVGLDYGAILEAWMKQRAAAPKVIKKPPTDTAETVRLKSRQSLGS